MSTLGRPSQNIYEKIGLDLVETLFIETTCKSTDVNLHIRVSVPFQQCFDHEHLVTGLATPCLPCLFAYHGNDRGTLGLLFSTSKLVSDLCPPV